MQLSSRKLPSAAAIVGCAGALSLGGAFVAGAFASPTSSPPSCPAGKPQAVHSGRDGASADLGTAVVAFFGYASGPEDPVAVGLAGCQVVTNGQLTRTARLSDLVRQLETLVPVKPAPSVRTDATIRGHVRLCGGPAPGRCRIGTIGTCGPGHGCVTIDRVTVTDATGTRIAQAPLHHARYSVKVPAGRYTVSLLADGRNVIGRVTATRTITARAGRTTRVVFQFDVP